jgi:hypothetical protein
MRGVLLAVGLISAAVTGCSLATGTGGQGPASIDPPQKQDWALGDGVVTVTEYHLAVDRFITCVRDAGYEVSRPVLSPIDGLSLLYDIAPSGEPKIYNDAVQTCNLSHLSLTEPAFVESQSQVMNETLRQAVVECLRSQGSPATGEERNATEFATTTRNNEIVLGCVVDSTHKLFPELPDVLTVRI